MNYTKKAKLNTGLVTSARVGIVMLVVLFSALAGVLPSAQDAGDSLNETSRCVAEGGYWNVTTADVECRTNSTANETTLVEYSPVPLSGLFSGTGLIFLVIMAGIAMVIIKSQLNKK